MKDNFVSSLARVLVHEGGFVNDPRDPGGATNKGVTQAVYDDYRRSQGAGPRSVKSLEQSELEAIYRKLYWDVIRGDELPSGLDYCLFDFAVNSGPARAAKFLQRELGVADDGKIGPMTLAAVRSKDVNSLIAGVCCARQSFLESLGTFKHFGKGWTRRVADVQASAVRLA